MEGQLAPSFRWWLSQAIAEKRLRGSSHREMVKRIAALIPTDVSKGTPLAQLNAWVNWTVLRNAIAHAAMTVGEDLVVAWPVRFPRHAARIELAFEEVGAVAAAAMALAKTLDKRFVSEIVQHADAELLVREVFARLGVADEGLLLQRVHGTLGARIRRDRVQRAVAEQRGTAGEVFGFHFSDDLLLPLDG